MSSAGALMMRKVNDLNFEWFSSVLSYNYITYPRRIEEFVTLHGTVLKNIQESDECLLYAISSEIVTGKMEYLQNINFPEDFHLIDFVETDKFLTALNEWMKTAITLIRLPTLRAFDQYVAVQLASREREVYMPLVLQCRDLVSTVIQTILDDTEVHIIEHERREKAENAVARALSLENNSLDSKHDAASSNAFGMRSPDQSMQRRDNYVQSETFNREPLIRRNFLEEEFKLQLENLSRELYQVTEEMPGDDFSQEAQAEDRTPFEQLESDPNVEQETRDTNVRNAQKGLEDLMKNLGLK